MSNNSKPGKESRNAKASDPIFRAAARANLIAFTEHPRYIEVFGDLKPFHPNKWSQHEIIVSRSPTAQPQKDPSITALGAEQAVIGRRVDEIICDDIVDEDWAEISPVPAPLRIKSDQNHLQQKRRDGEESQVKQIMPASLP